MRVRYELPSLLDVLLVRLLLEVQSSGQICQVSHHLRLPCQCSEFQDKQKLGHPASFPDTGTPTNICLSQTKNLDLMICLYCGSQAENLLFANSLGPLA